jgi:hypothetical protein
MKKWAIILLLSASTACATPPAARKPAADGGDHPNLILKCAIYSVKVSATVVQASITACKVFSEGGTFVKFDKMIGDMVLDSAPTSRQPADAHYLDRAASVLSGALASNREIEFLVPKENVEANTGNIYRIVNPIDILQRSP